MLMLPVSAFAAMILSWLSLRTLLRDEQPLLSGLLAACTIQSLTVTLAVGYDVSLFYGLLPVTAAFIPPLTWIPFRSGFVQPMTLPKILPHLSGPLFTLFCSIFAPEVLDVIIPLIFAGYGAAILITLRRNPDLPLARIEAGGLSGMLWRSLGWLLIASALSDVLIAAAFAFGKPDWAGWIISFFTSVILLFIGMISTMRDAQGEKESDEKPTAAMDLDAETVTEDKTILAAIDRLLTQQKIHLEPGLTLQRLARRVHLPEKRVSAAINRETGDNVSRYINHWRINHACDLIRAGTSITAAMLASGFNTKSNFNREFLRETGCSPSAWMKTQTTEKEASSSHDVQASGNLN